MKITFRAVLPENLRKQIRPECNFLLKPVLILPIMKTNTLH